MPVDITISETNDYILLNYSGNISNDDLLYSIKKAVELQSENEINSYLADCSNMISSHSILDIFSKVQTMQNMGIRKDLKEAIVLPLNTESADKVKFYETACLNRGYRVKIFSDKNEALNWLLNE